MILEWSDSRWRLCAPCPTAASHRRGCPGSARDEGDNVDRTIRLVDKQLICRHFIPGPLVLFVQRLGDDEQVTIGPRPVEARRRVVGRVADRVYIPTIR